MLKVTLSTIHKSAGTVVDPHSPDSSGQCLAFRLMGNTIGFALCHASLALKKPTALVIASSLMSGCVWA